MEELWQKGTELIKKEKWTTLITNLKKDETTTNKEEAQQILREKLFATIKTRLPQGKFGIFFSGGVDSSLIAAICNHLGADFTCYTVGFQDQETKEPEDITEAKKVAQKFGFELKYKIFNLTEAEEIVQKTVKILRPVGKDDVVNVGVGAVVLAATELAQKDKITCFFSGLGSEEIFAGYERHGKANDINLECWQGLKEMYNRDLIRDFTLAQELNTKIKTPFLDPELIEYAMTLPAEWKLNGEKKKIILREIAEEFLGEFAWRKKKAAQYGSCFDKAISKLARKNGFKFKKEWLNNLHLK